MNLRGVLSNWELFAHSPEAVPRLRELILQLAVQGKLVPQDPKDEPASELLKKIKAEKERLVKEGKIKRDKPLAVIEEEEKPFELPTGWQWVRCGDYFIELCTGPFGSVIHKNDYVNDGVPLINPSHMVSGKIVHDSRITLNPEDAKRLASYSLSSGDIVLARRGEVGRYAIVTEREHGWLCGTGSFFARLYETCNRQYLGLLFSDVRFRAHLLGESVGTTMTNLNQGILLDALIALPPLAEQSRIVTRVQELMQLCDALEAKVKLQAQQHETLLRTLLATLTQSASSEDLAQNWQRVSKHFPLLLDRVEAIDQLEQTILQLAVRGLLVPQNPTDEPASQLLKKIRTEKDKLIQEGKIKRDKPLPPIAEDEQPFELPTGWEWVRVNDVVEMLNGYAFKSEWFKSSGVKLLRNLNISHGFVDWAQPAMIESKAAVDYQQFALQAGDIVLSLDRPIISTGLKYAVIQDSDLPCLLLQRVARLAPKIRLVFSEFIVLWLQSDLFAGTIDPGRSNGVPHISTKQVGELNFPLPPLPEQHRIVTRVTELRQLCAALRSHLAQSSQIQAQLAQALVSQVA